MVTISMRSAREEQHDHCVAFFLCGDQPHHLEHYQIKALPCHHQPPPHPQSQYPPITAHLSQAPVCSKTQGVGGVQEPLQAVRHLNCTIRPRAPPRGGQRLPQGTGAIRSSSRRGGTQGGGDVAAPNECIGVSGPACLPFKQTCACGTCGMAAREQLSTSCSSY